MKRNGAELVKWHGVRVGGTVRLSGVLLYLFGFTPGVALYTALNLDRLIIQRLQGDGDWDVLTTQLQIIRKFRHMLDSECRLQK